MSVGHVHSVHSTGPGNLLRRGSVFAWNLGIAAIAVASGWVFLGQHFAVSLALGAMVEAWNTFTGEPQELELPSAPRRPTIYLDGTAHPQPKLHRDLEGGMAVSVGRLRPCPLLDFKFVALSHNTVRGAAGGSLLVAELAVAKGLL